jgi:hypothetical protein
MTSPNTTNHFKKTSHYTQWKKMKTTSSPTTTYTIATNTKTYTTATKTSKLLMKSKPS